MSQILLINANKKTVDCLESLCYNKDTKKKIQKRKEKFYGILQID